MKTETEVRIEMEGGSHVSGILARPAEPKWLLVLGHGAGAGMHHPFMGALAEELAGVGVATLRYQFPYMEERRKVPDKPAVLMATVAAAVRAARQFLGQKAGPDFPLLGGGKEVGGPENFPAGAGGVFPGRARVGVFCFFSRPPDTAWSEARR